METRQGNTFIVVVFAVLLCLVALLGFFTWSLSLQVRELQASVLPQNPVGSTSTGLSARAQTLPPIPQNIPQSSGGTGTPVDPSDPLSGFRDPFDDSWPRFMYPADSFAEMQQRMDELMDSVTQGFPFFNQEDFGFDFINRGPAVRMTEDQDAYRIAIEVPDGQEVEVNTEIDGNILMVSGSVKSERDIQASDFSSRSMQESRFSQSVYLSEPVDEEGMTTERAGDEIIITLPKTGSRLPV